MENHHQPFQKETSTASAGAFGLTLRHAIQRRYDLATFAKPIASARRFDKRSEKHALKCAVAFWERYLEYRARSPCFGQLQHPAMAAYQFRGNGQT